MSWKRIKRKIIYETKYLKVYEDTLELPNGKIIEDYSVVKKPDVVIVVPTDKEENLISLLEYKYAAGKELFTVPAGHKEQRESPIKTAKRELLEETGYNGGIFKLVGMLYEYPTKDLHTVYVVRAENVEKKKDTQHEDTEQIRIRLVPKEQLRKEILENKWQISSVLAAIFLSNFLSG